MKVVNVDTLIDDLSIADIERKTIDRVVSIINKQKTYDYPKKGRWIPAGSDGYECSKCWSVSKNISLCCPICGSRNKIIREEIKNERSKET